MSQGERVNRDEHDRIEHLEGVDRIGSVPSILRVIRETTGLRLAFVARVTDSSWKACAVLDEMDFGLAPGQHLEVATTLCADVRDTRRAIVIDHASRDPIYQHHHTPKLYGLESYISVPIFLPDGTYFGNVCALDSAPVSLRDGQALSMMTIFAELIGRQLEAEHRQERTERQLLDERQTSELREQFIAVLGHDLRAPLSAITMGTELLLATDLGPTQRTVTDRMRNSARRMTRLVSDVLDFARGRLGGGIPVTPVPIADVRAIFEHVVSELQLAHPAREIRFTGEGASMEGDHARLAQVISNLLSNALHHGDHAAPIEIELGSSDDEVTLRVSNRGAAISEALLPKLFKPYERHHGPAGEGLGLGLYIVAEVMRSHGGRVEALTDEPGVITLVCTFPRDSAPVTH